MNSQPTQFRSGFTALELLVVLSVLAVLMTLIVPAVQHSREASRSIACRNRLRQLGVANYNFHETNKEFPADGTRMWRLLPYVEQQALHDELEKYAPYSLLNQEAGVPVPTEELSPNVSTFVCPSSLAVAADFEFSYFANAGTFWTGVDSDKQKRDSRRNGMSSTHWITGGVRLRNIYDGASNTAFMSEIRRPERFEKLQTDHPVAFKRGDPPFFWQTSTIPTSTEEYGRLSEAPTKQAPMQSQLIHDKFHTFVWGLYKHIAGPNKAACMVPSYAVGTAIAVESLPPSSNHDGGV